MFTLQTRHQNRAIPQGCQHRKQLDAQWGQPNTRQTKTKSKSVGPLGTKLDTVITCSIIALAAVMRDE